MSATAFDFLLKILRKTAKLYEGDAYVAATNTTATQVISTALTQADDAWNGGIIACTYDAAGLGAAPQGESRDITDYVLSTHIVTVGAAFSVAVTAGDKFVISKKIATGLSRATIFDCLQAALSWYGKVPDEDVTLSTAYNTLEYTLPTAVDETSLFQVWLAAQTAAPWEWYEVGQWRVDLEARTLIFDDFPPYTYKIKLVSLHDAPTITGDATAISGHYQPDALVNYAYAEVLRRRLPTLSSTARANLQEEMNFAYQLAEKLKTEHPLPSRLVQRRAKLWTPIIESPSFADRISLPPSEPHP